MIHPTGTGRWLVYVALDGSLRTEVPGHTAFEAYEAARAELETQMEHRTKVRSPIAFGHVSCELLEDEWREGLRSERVA